MEKYTLPRGRGGWQEDEKKLLFTLVEDAAKNGTPLRSVFDTVAEKTGRKPNSIRNFYYISLKQGDVSKDICPKAAPFTPFEEDELRYLVSNVLLGRLSGRSVRACVMELGNGDKAKTLRFQNKYRSILKNRPEYVENIKAELSLQGYDFPEEFTPVRRKKVPYIPVFEERESLLSAFESGSDEFLDALISLLRSLKGDIDAI